MTDGITKEEIKNIEELIKKIDPDGKLFSEALMYIKEKKSTSDSSVKVKEKSNKPVK